MILTCSQGCQLLNWIETVVPKLWFWFNKFPNLGSGQSNSGAQGISLCPPLHLGTFFFRVGQPAYLSASGAPDDGPLIKCRNNPFPLRETPEPQCPHIPQVRPSCSWSFLPGPACGQFGGTHVPPKQVIMLRDGAGWIHLLRPNTI